MNKEENIPVRNNSQKDNSIKEYKDNAITDEADFYSFLDQCKNNKIFGIANQLHELEQLDISPEMRRKIVEYYMDDARNNKFDLEALEKFRKDTATAGNAKILWAQDDLIEKISRIRDGMRKFADFFDSRKTSTTADKLQGYLKFLATEAPGAKIDRLTLFSFNRFFKPDGEIRIAQELEKVRRIMMHRSRFIHAIYDAEVRDEINRLSESLPAVTDPKRITQIQNELKILSDFLELPGNLEVKNSAIEEISNRLKARNIRSPLELNQAPQGGIFRAVLNDCTIEGSWDGSTLRIDETSFNPAHNMTYALNVNLKNPDIVQQAIEWYNFTVRVMGAGGALTFYEMVGYLLITRYPLPTERTILVLIGDPGSGKGTHLAAVQGILTFGNLTMFAKAGPHKLADPREHFSKQNLQNKLALIDGDMTHARIRDFSAINDLFGGEPSEFEKKFKDPTVERPIFKAFWASAPPLFRITQAGGAWRRLLLIALNPAATLDSSLKPKMLGMLDGFFLNGLIGLSYLIANGWKFTGELSNDAIEELWSFHSDSVQVWAQDQNLMPEIPEIETKAAGKETLDGDDKTVMTENTTAMRVIDDLYEQYESWCRRKQIEPVKPKTFSAWLRDHDFPIAKKTVGDGKFQGKRKYVTFVSMDDHHEGSENSKTNRTVDQFSWEAYFSKAPLTLDLVSDSHGQIPPHARENENDGLSCVHAHVHELPPRIGQYNQSSQKTRISGSGDNSPPCPIHFQDQSSYHEGQGSDGPGQSSISLSDPTKSDVPKQNPLHAMVMDILTRLSSLTGNTRIDPQEIMDAWPSTSPIQCPGWNELTSRILPTMAGEGLLHISNGMVEVSS